MGRLIVSAQLTVDAVMDHIEDWFSPDLPTSQRTLEQLRAADALLLGRQTYEHFAAAWPGISTDPPGIAELMNSRPKFVASRSWRGPLDWHASLLTGDVPAQVAELKQQLPGDLLSFGCGELAAGLARAGLVDEIRFWVYPVVWGAGVRAFDGGRPPVRLELAGAEAFSSGVALLRYRPVP